MKRSLILAVGLALAACGPPTYGDFLDQLTDAWCRREVRCGRRADGQPGCRVAPAVLLPRSDLDIAKALEERRMRYDPLAAKACIERVDESVCDDQGLVLAARAKCRVVVAPRVEAYGACLGFDDCLGGWCTSINDPCNGHCEPYLPEGAPCATNPAACDPTIHVCDGTSCVARGSRGAPCADDSFCQIDLLCLDGTCDRQPRPGRGQACDAIRYCNDGTYCRDGVCFDRVDRDGVCDHPSACKSELLCVGLSTTTSGRCAAPAGLDDECVLDATITGCPDSTFCGPDSKCRPNPNPEAGWNETCAVDPCADEMVCLSSTCVLTVGLGGGCAGDDVCQPGLSCIENRCVNASCVAL